MVETWLAMLPMMRCPYSGLPLNAGEGGLHSEERSYPLIDGIPSLVADGRVAPIDKLFQNQYGERTAGMYDVALKLQSLLIGCWEPAQRRRLVRLLDPPRGGRVLEVAVGTGANLPHLAPAVGPEGHIVGVDLSAAMMKVAQKRARGLSLPVHLIRADACHLPFADNSFDAVFHFGGINMFGDVSRGIAEMVRVAKPGAPVVVSDEGMSEARRRTWLGRRLGKINSLNLCRPPFEQLRWDDVHDFEVHWAWRELFYVLRFRKGARPFSPAAETARVEVRRRIGFSA